jgi:RNA polymerase sigma-70 factor (ECF subfamily)
METHMVPNQSGLLEVLMGDRSDERTREFMSLWTTGARRIFAFILSLLPRWNDAEDVLQETSILLWERFDEYKPGSDFVAWGCRVAYLKVLEYRRKKNATCFSDALVGTLHDVAQRESASLSNRASALVDCMKLLTPRDREMISLRYEPRASVRTVAAATQRSVDATYKALNRVHDQLFECVQRALHDEERSS